MDGLFKKRAQFLVLRRFDRNGEKGEGKVGVW